MRAIRNLALSGLLAATVTVTVRGCFADQGAPDPEPSATATLEGGTADWFDRAGQAAGTGFEPLTVPPGVPHGELDGLGDWLTVTGANPAEGDTSVVYTPAPYLDVIAEPVILTAVDAVSVPVSGAERNWVLSQLGVPASTNTVVQRVTIRVREIARSGGSDEDVAGWSFPAAFTPINNAGDTMTWVLDDDGRFGCAGTATPLASHPMTTNDTVQVCAYAVGDVTANASMWVNGIRVNGVADGVARPFTVASTTLQPNIGGE